MVDIYTRRSIKFEEREGHVAWSEQEPNVSKDEDVVGDAGAGDSHAVLVEDDQNVSGDDMCVDFYELRDQRADWSVSVLLASRMRILSCR